MTTIIKELIFDKELVSLLKSEKADSHQLYQQLIHGRITLQEYLAAVK